MMMMVFSDGNNEDQRGTNYIRWGRMTCEGNATLVYKGSNISSSSHTRTVVRECCKGDDASQWGNGKFDPITTPKPLNRSSPKVAHVIMFQISTHMQNLVTISQGKSFPRMREIAHQRCLLGFFFPGSSNSLQPRGLNRFSRLIRQATRIHARMCLFGVRRQKFNTYTP